MKLDLRSTPLETIEQQLREYELTYHVPSRELASAFTSSQLETPELRRWSRLYRTWEAAVAARPR